MIQFEISIKFAFTIDITARPIVIVCVRFYSQKMKIIWWKIKFVTVVREWLNVTL